MFGAAGVQAQDTLEIQGAAPDLYLSHIVKKGETFYSLSRTYSVPPKEIAAQNNLSFEGGLQLGQTVKIPLTQNNFLQGSDAAGGHPVYHRVTEKETLYRISVNYNKVPLDNIRQWNNFAGDGVKKDGYLIVGWLKAGSSAAAAPVNHPAPATPPPATETTTVVKKEQPSPALTPAPPVITPAPPVQTGTETVKKETPPPSAPTNTPAKKEQAPPPATPLPAASSNSSFEQVYEQQTAGKKVTTEKGPGSWFKSNAGAGKYYALHNTASRGTIIKVTNPLNGRSIYAKVLEAIPQMKQNAGLIIKLSDSALEALGTNEARFYCELSYEN
jgi:LysM repeat protein